MTAQYFEDFAVGQVYGSSRLTVDKERMGRAFALHTFSGNLGFAAAPPVMAVLMVAVGWRMSLVLEKAGRIRLSRNLQMLLRRERMFPVRRQECRRHAGSNRLRSESKVKV